VTVFRAASGVLAGFLLPGVAGAHLVTTGLGPIYDGISHVLLSPDDLVPVLAMALLAGLNGPVSGRRTLFTLTGAWLAGSVAGFLVARPLVPGTASTLSFLALGLLVAADRRLSPAIVAAIAIACGLLHGWLNGAGIADERRELLAVVGIVTAIFIVVALVAAFVVSLRAGWARVAVRVAGSWVAAIGLLTLGWGLRGN
jgi:urease accessory protein